MGFEHTIFWFSVHAFTNWAKLKYVSIYLLNCQIKEYKSLIELKNNCLLKYKIKNIYKGSNHKIAKIRSMSLFGNSDFKGFQNGF